MRSGWPHTEADRGRRPADQRRGPFGPETSWPTGYSGLEYREGDYRYSASSGPQPAIEGEHPYTAASAAGYGDDGYRDPGYDGPAAQDAGYAQTDYAQGGYGPAGQSRAGYGQYGPPGSGYGSDGQIDLAYPPAGDIDLAYPPAADPGYQPAYQPESRWQAWDYEQPLHYDDDEEHSPAQDGYGRRDGHGRPDDYPDSDGRGPGGYLGAPVYDPADYNGSAHSRPGFDGPGYDLSGIIGTGDFEAFGYGEHGYGESGSGRLSYDDPRYDDPRYDDRRYDPPGGPRFDETRLDFGTGGFGALGGTPHGDARVSDETRFDMRRFDETRLDSLWLPDEDPRHGELTGYGSDGFGGDGPVRSGYSDFAAQASGRFDETRLDLGAGPWIDASGPNDVLAFDDTRFGNRRALGPGTAATGVLAPWDARPRSWADETSFDDLDDYGVLDDEPVRAPAAFVRTDQRPERLERPADTGARRAPGRRRGRSGDRRQWMALGAIAVVAAGAIGGVLMKFVHSGPSGPAHTVVAPNQADGFTRMPALEKQMKVDALRESVMQDSSGQASNLVSAVYQQGSAAAGANAQIFMFVGGKLAGASPGASVTSFKQSYPGAQVAPAGSLGGDAVCAERQLNGQGVAMCVWFDNDSFGALVSPTMTTAALATTLDRVRPSLEHYAQ